VPDLWTDAVEPRDPEAFGLALPPDAVADPLSVPAPPSASDVDGLAGLALRVAPAVVVLKAWDAAGAVLATTVGCLVSSDGLVLTDAELVHPSFASRIDSITAIAGDGTPYRIAALRAQDSATGATLLRAEVSGTDPVPVLAVSPDATGGDAVKPVHVLAFREERGLSLADARMQEDRSLAGEGWFRLSGEDSAGAPGSPVIDDEGRVLALVALRVGESNWFNFAVPVRVLDRLRAAPAERETPVDRLPAGGTERATDDPRFVELFKSIYEGRVRGSLPDLLRMTRRYPRSAEPWALLALVSARLGATEEARDCAAKAAALDPGGGIYWYQLGVLAATGPGGKEQLAGSSEYFERAVRESPANRLAWFLLGRSRLAAGEYPAAADAFRQAVRVDPDFAEAFFLLAYSLGRAGDVRSALAAIGESVRLRRDDPRGWYYAALLHRHQGDLDEARKAMKRVTDLQPNHPRAWLALAHLQRQAGDMANARVSFDRHNRLPQPGAGGAVEAGQRKPKSPSAVRTVSGPG